MNKKILPVALAFVVIGLAFLVIFRNSTPGLIGGVCFIVAGIMFMIRGRANGA